MGGRPGSAEQGQAGMEELAARQGMTLGALMAACGIAKPRVKAKAQGRTLAP